MVAVVVDTDYPSRIVWSLVSKALEEFRILHVSAVPNINKDILLPVPAIVDLLSKYQDPSKVDPLTRVELELASTKGVRTLIFSTLVICFYLTRL